MASKSAQSESEKAGMIEELLDHCDTTLDRVKTLYEQYFLGIQKQPPTHLHTDVERKLRELQQIQIRNTALRYRLATIQQKFGSYNNYWRRTLRQIENGTYHRNLAKIGRQAALTGEEIPEEILAAMPKRMQEQVKRDRDAALARMRRRGGAGDEAADVDVDFGEDDVTGVTAAPVARKTSGGAHVLDEDEGDFDLDAYFAAVTNDDAAPAASLSRPAAPAAPSRAAPVARPAASDDTNPEAPPFDDEDDVAVVSSRPAPPSTPPPVGSPALRAAGLRTPPLGIPRVTSAIPKVGAPASPPHAASSNPAAASSNPTPPHAASSNPASAHAASSNPAAPPRVQPISPALRDSQAIATTAIPTMRDPRVPMPPNSDVIPTMAIPVIRTPGGARTPATGMPSIPSPGLPSIPTPGPARPAPSQGARPLPVMPGAASQRGPVPVETLAGPFPRESAQPARPGTVAPPTPPPPTKTQGIPRPPPPPPPTSTQAIPRPTQAIPRPTQAIPRVAEGGERAKPPPGMTDADVNALYAKYVKAKEAVGEKTGPGSYGKLLQTINAQAPKIMEQYKAKGVEFQVVVKDNQVVIRAKPKP